MAYEKKYDWPIIKKDYLSHRFKNAKELAEHYDVNYGYLKKKTAIWNKERKLAKQLAKKNKDTTKDTKGDTKATPLDTKATPQDSNLDTPLENFDIFDTININFSNPEDLKGDYIAPTDRRERLLRLWDKLSYIVETSLNNAEFNFFTNDGKLKAKALSDMAIILEKIQKANEANFADSKITGQLNEYVDMFNQIKSNQPQDNQEEADNEGVVDDDKQ